MPGVGPTLREARIQARIDMAEVEDRTKIRAELLQAIENEQWDLLPEPVYTKGFVRTYGNYLGLDSKMLVEEFQRSYEQPAEDGQPGRESIDGHGPRLRARFEGRLPRFQGGHGHRLRTRFEGRLPRFQGSSRQRLRTRFARPNREFLPGYGYRLRAMVDERGSEWVILALGLAAAVVLGMLIAG